MRRTKIIVTIGPSSSKKVVIRKMISKGADAVRLNFSHGTLQEKKDIILKIREEASNLKKHIPIIADLQGPVIRIYTSPESLVVKKEEKIEIKKGRGKIKVNNTEFFENVEVNDILLVDDGKLVFKVIKKDNGILKVVSQVDGILYSRKKVLIKDKEISSAPLTDKDVKDLEFAVKNRVEYIALSMVKSDKDIIMLKSYLSNLRDRPWILAKIETPSGVKNIKKISEECDGVIVARGDLGQYYPLQQIPIIQKKIIEEGNKRGKITVVATQILESMRENETPTRAEITDIFNSVEEKVDAIMLTGETAIGKYPVDVVSWASSILEEADKEYLSEIMYYKKDFHENIYDKFARGVIYISHILDSKILGFTKKGNTARRLARYRPKKEVFIATYDPLISNKINLLYAVNPLLSEEREDYWNTLSEAMKELREKRILKKGDIVIFTVGIREESTDMLKIETV